MKEALRAADIAFEGKEMITARATAYEVANALRDKGLIPDFIAGEIAAAALAAHPDQAKVNQQIAAETAAFISRISQQTRTRAGR